MEIRITETELEADNTSRETRVFRACRSRRRAPKNAHGVRGPTALVALLLAVNALDIGPALAAWSTTPTSMTVNVHATVIERTAMKIQHQVPVLVITKKDVQQGYADAPEATMYEVKSNNSLGYLLYFESMEGPITNYFNAIDVIADGKEVQLSPSGGHILRPYVRDGAKTKISYRFLLSPDAKPGTYNWPLKVSVAPR